ncbi:WhiB family transcriptional regulator [Streptomyces sp. NPDC053079]|uniref:WhiB family transcriptional regulator n=1 Tax=Streptomyces sp. NPDC053079 TaxID=3365697 RepID=UPI0037D91627
MLDWFPYAACQGSDVDLFFPVGKDADAMQQAGDAKNICRRCPVRLQCLDYALTSGEQYGIWGGVEADQRCPQDEGDLERLFRSRTEAIDGSHLLWTGYVSRRGTPQVRHGTRNKSAYRIAFYLHHGRHPRGYVTSSCGQDGCVEPSHMQDETTRTQQQSA